MKKSAGKPKIRRLNREELRVAQGGAGLAARLTQHARWRALANDVDAPRGSDRAGHRTKRL